MNIELFFWLDEVSFIHLNGDGTSWQVFSASIQDIKTESDVAIASNSLMKYDWYSQQLKNEFESKLIRMLNNI